MANAKIVQAEPVLELTLTETEAKYLRDLLQNPVGYLDNPDAEPQQHYDIRNTIFDALHLPLRGLNHG